jgi:hypothetical protein
MLLNSSFRTYNGIRIQNSEICYAEKNTHTIIRSRCDLLVITSRTERDHLLSASN